MDTVVIRRSLIVALEFNSIQFANVKSQCGMSADRKRALKLVELFVNNRYDVSHHYNDNQIGLKPITSGSFLDNKSYTTKEDRPISDSGDDSDSATVTQAQNSVALICHKWHQSLGHSSGRCIATTVKDSRQDRTALSPFWPATSLRGRKMVLANAVRDKYIKFLVFLCMLECLIK